VKIKAPFQCDYCGAVKGDANHWILRPKGEDVIRGAYYASFILWPWNDEDAARSDVQHICGNVCAGKALEKWLGSQTT
jgi:hypothetical protein